MNTMEQPLDLFKIVHVTAPALSKATETHPTGQNFITASVQKLRPELLGLGYNHLISSQKTEKVSFYEDDPFTYETVKNSPKDSLIEGKFITKNIFPHFIKGKDGKFIKYPLTFAIESLRGKPVVATSIKFFVFGNDNPDTIERRVTLRTNLQRVPEAELLAYKEILTANVTNGTGQTATITAQEDEPLTSTVNAVQEDEPLTQETAPTT